METFQQIKTGTTNSRALRSSALLSNKKRKICSSLQSETVVKKGTQKDSFIPKSTKFNLYDGKKRCSWVTSDPVYVQYHDEEWGISAKGDDRKLFEMICLEGAQAGLSWLTILRKRDNYRRAFKGFDINACAKISDSDLAEIQNERDKSKAVVLNKAKVFSVRSNAISALTITEKFGSLSNYLWQFSPLPNQSGVQIAPMMTTSKESIALSNDLKKYGFKFVGPTIIHAFMQAIGMINCHSPNCFKSRTNR